MKIETTRFGPLDTSEDDLITFPEGIIGYPDRKRFVLLQNSPEDPFCWLQSTEDPALAFVVADPTRFVPDYTVKVPPEEVSPISLAGVGDARILVFVVIPAENPLETHLNLRGPVVINTANRLARQLVLSEEYPLRHTLVGAGA